MCFLYYLMQLIKTYTRFVLQVASLFWPELQLREWTVPINVMFVSVYLYLYNDVQDFSHQSGVTKCE